MSSTIFLLAQRHNWERLGEQFSGSNAKLQPRDILMIVAAVAGAALLVGVLSLAARWQEGRIAKPNAGRLFRELCRAHRLNRWERRVITTLAEEIGARQPAEVFVRPDAFEGSAIAAFGDRPAALQQLRIKLFGDMQ